jgi:hypothetical protein
MAETGVDFGVLGPLQVTVGGDPLPLAHTGRADGVPTARSGCGRRSTVEERP